MIRQAPNPTDELDRLIAWDRMWEQPREAVHVDRPEQTESVEPCGFSIDGESNETDNRKAS